ncbi:MAG: hypothetical protein KF781_05810 [Chitinophagaceae bacterium]|nr:hypothetical protein [Chitinophagaceae bacterium]MCW5905550.1 hypothetical protein [Chitinophagaceae bacterium]
MKTEQVRKQVHELIDKIDSNEELNLLYETAEVYVSKQTDIIDILTPEQYNRLQNSVQQVREEKIISHEEVMNLSKQWLSK